MPITINGTTVDTVIANGVTITSFIVNGVEVMASVQTDAPSIAQQSNAKKEVTMRFTNNDASDVTLYADQDVTDPTTNRGTVLAGSYLDIVFTTGSRFSTNTYYAKAQASGETMSTITSAQGTAG